jgi:hypothetical protein
VQQLIAPIGVKVQKVSVDLVVLDREKLEPIFASDVSLLAPAKE